MLLVESTKIILSLAAFVASILLAYQLNKLNAFQFLGLRKNRYGSIDGLRGYLAFSVFIHHFVLTWYWKSSGEWERPPEAYFQNLGKFGIAIFFMITGFLFISKILSSKQPINWYRLYQSRVFRIYPLYLFVIGLITFIVFFKSDFQLKADTLTLIKDYFKWFIFHGNEINHFHETRRIIAGVDWTLKYEWLFYVSLPLIALLLKQHKLFLIIALAGLLLLFLYPLRIEYFYTRYFILFAIGGLTAALNLDKSHFKKWINGSQCSLFVLLALLGAIFYPDTFSAVHVILMSLFFIPIALGNTLFGLFNTKASIYLGEISYSIYLLHGTVLYTLFSIINLDIGHIPITTALMWLPLVGLIVVLFSTVTYLLIEKPFIHFGRTHRLFERFLSKQA